MNNFGNSNCQLTVELNGITDFFITETEELNWRNNISNETEITPSFTDN
jgi:hypothetical protein